jgi:hypothetical protein
MSDISGRRDARAELINDPSPGSPANPERFEPNPSPQPDHTVSGWTLAAATVLGLFVLTLVFYGLNNNEPATTVASTGGEATAPSNPNASAQNPQDQTKNDQAKASAAAPSQQDNNAANQPSQTPPGAAANPQAQNTDQPPAAQNSDTRSSNTGGTAAAPPK